MLVHRVLRNKHKKSRFPARPLPFPKRTQARERSLLRHLSRRARGIGRDRCVCAESGRGALGERRQRLGRHGGDALQPLAARPRLPAAPPAAVAGAPAHVRPRGDRSSPPRVQRHVRPTACPPPLARACSPSTPCSSLPSPSVRPEQGPFVVLVVPAPASNAPVDWLTLRVLQRVVFPEGARVRTRAAGRCLAIGVSPAEQRARRAGPGTSDASPRA